MSSSTKKPDCIRKNKIHHIAKEIKSTFNHHKRNLKATYLLTNFLGRDKCSSISYSDNYERLKIDAHK